MCLSKIKANDNDYDDCGGRRCEHEINNELETETETADDRTELNDVNGKRWWSEPIRTDKSRCWRKNGRTIRVVDRWTYSDHITSQILSEYFTRCRVSNLFTIVPSDRIYWYGSSMSKHPKTFYSILFLFYTAPSSSSARFRPFQRILSIQQTVEILV